ncbi:unnamed protein product [Spirodela intermedia]|uniref:Kinesin motor domain-containing protein n=1 Tax=Spirodela intermedia TaxID=51605 RepID=A0A7I8IR29_SPIIN|nr:unnamed protein product [Spirodela intermedia]CAA6660430.1 unnamed protein product [Spirodela intermedia]
MSSSSLKSSQRSSISPFRSRKPVSLAVAASSGSKPAARPTTPSSVSSSSARPTTPSFLSGRPTTPLSVSRPTHPVRPSPVSPVVPSPSERLEPPRPRRMSQSHAREINKGDEIAWYADGDYTVRNEYNASIGYSFDRVFGPATTTRHVYDVAAQHVVSGAMQGINGTVFAYGVTSSGKTHTMHGDQKSPGIIPLAVKDVFSIIQETPGREFLLRVSYLEIYNEVINDLLDPTGQNLRIREDCQGTYVEGIKEEVVLSPAHALSLIASGEEHRHVGSNNFNLLSSRSHTIFTLTVESSPTGDNDEDDDVTLSQLNLIDLAGSESSKTETTGLRRKEGSYINKSLLTLGTVISKLTDCKATHIPYRDSKLTRLLQSSLSGHGRVSLICTVTPASSNSEETHNTLKFAFRSKHVEIKAFQNKIMDEKSLIKKYQKEITSLKQELQQLKRGMMENPFLIANNQEDLLNLKLQLEAGQVKLQSRLEEEEQAKAALMGRIQRLTRLILVSTKSMMPSNVSEKPTHRRRHSFAEDELAYLPDRKREHIDEDDDDGDRLDLEFSRDGRFDATCLEDSTIFDKRNRRRGMLGWLKLRSRPDHISGLSAVTDNESSGSGSPSCSNSSQQNKKCDDPSVVDFIPERTQAGDLFYATTRDTGTTITDQMDLMQEQVKMLAGEVALCTSSLKRLSEQAEHMRKLKDEIREKKLQMRVLEQRMFGSFESSPHSLNNHEMSQALSKMATQLNEKTFELEIMSADNRILQDQLQMKISENAEIQETVLMLRQQLNSLLDKSSDNQNQTAESEVYSLGNFSAESSKANVGWDETSLEETNMDENTPKSTLSLSGKFLREDFRGSNCDTSLKSQVLIQASEIENLMQEKVRLAEEKDGLEIQSQKLAEEASYAKELASAAAVELRNLAEEVTKLSYQNAKLTSDLVAAKEAASVRISSQRNGLLDAKQDACLKKSDGHLMPKEASLEAALSVRDKREADLLKRIEEGKRREENLENELANMWVLIAKLNKSEVSSVKSLYNGDVSSELPPKFLNGFHSGNLRPGTKLKEDKLVNGAVGVAEPLEEVKAAYESEKRKRKELEGVLSRLKSEDLAGLDVAMLEELQSFHVEALSKICQEKVTPFPY